MNDEFDFENAMASLYPDTEYIINKSAYDSGVEGVREEIVRCKDCEYYRSHELFPIENAPDICIRIPYGVNVEPNGFCACGKKKLITEKTVKLFEEWGSDD